MPAPIQAAVASLAALERLIKILAEQYDNELIALYGVNPSTRKTGAGIYLPPVTRWYRQPEPSRITVQDVQHKVQGYCGQIGPVQYGAWRNDVGNSYVVPADTPYGVGIYFLDAPAGDVADAVQAVQLGPEEVLLLRAHHYLGALKHTLVKYGCHDDAITDVTPLADMGLGGAIGSREAGSDNRALQGIVMLEIGIRQDMAFPSHTALP
jgi:hypothetical protein